MKEMIQAGNFYDSLEEKDKKELTEAIAESLFFQEEALQKDVENPKLEEALKVLEKMAQ